VVSALQIVKKKLPIDIPVDATMINNNDVNQIVDIFYWEVT